MIKMEHGIEEERDEKKRGRRRGYRSNSRCE